MSATLKDLAPAEKQKVARLIRQVVEKERQLQDLEAALAERAGAVSSDAAAVAKAEQLAEQNQELARENTSLRAKLSHAFDLLRAYQHKCRVLDATVQVAASAGSRPTTPGSTWLDASLLSLHTAAHEGMLDAKESAGNNEWGNNACTPGRVGFGTAEGGMAAVGPAPSGSRQLSPVAEGPCEGASPSAARCTETAAAGESALRQHRYLDFPSVQQLPSMDAVVVARGSESVAAPAHEQAPLHSGAPSVDGSGIQLVATGAALPQLETLKLMAQALLEAQAEVAAKQVQQACTQAQLAALPSQPVGRGQAVTLQPAAQTALQHQQPQGSLVFDASLGIHGGCLFGQSSQPHAVHQCTEATGGVQRSSGGGDPPSEPPASASVRPPLADLKQQQLCADPSTTETSSCCCASTQHSGKHSTAGSGAYQRSAGGGAYQRSAGRVLGAFEGDLMELVWDVEGLLNPEDGCSTHIHKHAMHTSWRRGHDGEAAMQAMQLRQTHDLQYEENDLLDLISQL